MKSNRFIPLSVPNLTGKELQYVTKVIEEQWVSTAGSSITQFESKLAKYVGVEEACACQSGTAGLHLCLVHFGVKDGDVVLVPTLTFIATINAIMYQRATPVFFDCDDNLCINVEQIKKYIENDCTYDGEVLRQKSSNQVVKAIIPVHIFGDTCQMDSIMEIAKKYNLVVIEDATESLGTKFANGRFRDMYTGTVGDAGVFSFNGNKIITTGGGGMVVSKDNKLIEHIKYLSQQSKDDTLYFIHNEVGYNYRMTNVQAALGIAQLERLDEFIKIKHENYNLYCELLNDCKLGKMMKFSCGSNANYWFYSFCLNEENADIRDAMLKYLESNGIQARPIWTLNHKQKPFAECHVLSTDIAENYYNRILNIPCSSNLTSEDIYSVCSAIMDFAKQYS